METRFGAYFNEMASNSGLSVRRIATETKCHFTTIYKVIRGEAPVPEQYVGSWADALRLAPHERLRFWVLAMMSRAPDDVQDAVIRLCDEVLHLDAKRHELSSLVQRLAGELSPNRTLRVAEPTAAEYDTDHQETQNALPISRKRHQAPKSKTHASEPPTPPQAPNAPT